MNESIGQRIQRLRKQKKMTADELGVLIGKNRATVYRYENNYIENMPYTILVPIAKALETTPTYLLGIEETNKLDELANMKLTESELTELINYAKYIVGKRK